MEGINQNYIVYDYALKQNWPLGPETSDPSSFVNAYATRRNGGSQQSALLSGWQQLLVTVYNSTRGGGVTKSVIELEPALNLDRSGFM